MSAGWNDTVAAAKKVLGKDGKLPKPRVDPAAMIPIVTKAWEAFNKDRESLEKNLLDLQNAFSQSKNTFKQYEDLVEDDDLGLDSDKEDEKKKIDEATDLLLKKLREMQTGCDSNLERLGKLDRIVTDLRRLDLKC